MLRLVIVAALFAGPAIAAKEKTFVQGWCREVLTSPLYDTTDIFMHTNAKETSSCGFKEFQVIMHLRCKEDVTAVFFGTQCFMASGSHTNAGNVTYRVDDAPAQTIAMRHSNDNSSLGLWRGRQSIPFVKELLGGEKLTVRLTPYSDSPMTVTFDLSGLDEAIKPLRQSCGW